jgi:hypothetical protein
MFTYSSGHPVGGDHRSNNTDLKVMFSKDRKIASKTLQVGVSLISLVFGP